MAMVREQLLSPDLAIRLPKKILQVRQTHVLSQEYKLMRCKSIIRKDLIEVRVRPASDSATRMRLRYMGSRVKQ